MEKKVKYVVRLEISYVNVSFEFDTSTLACHFMDMFLDHVYDGTKVNIYMERVDVIGEEE